MTTTTRNTYISSVTAAAKAVSDANAWAAYWNSVNSNTQQAAQGSITNATLVANLSTARTTLLTTLNSDIATQNATVDGAKATLRNAGGDSDPF